MKTFGLKHAMLRNQNMCYIVDVKLHNSINRMNVARSIYNSNACVCCSLVLAALWTFAELIKLVDVETEE